MIEPQFVEHAGSWVLEAACDIAIRRTIGGYVVLEDSFNRGTFKTLDEAMAFGRKLWARNLEMRA